MYHRTVELDIPSQDGKKLLGENMGFIVAWRKRYISFDSKSDSNDHDADGREDLHPPSLAPERDPKSAASTGSKYAASKGHNSVASKGPKFVTTTKDLKY
jgi:hypothetical protein